MPKVKTHQATAKRFQKTGGKKLKQRKCGQDHYNSRESGNTLRKKRRDITTNSTMSKTVMMLTPYK